MHLKFVISFFHLKADLFTCQIHSVGPNRSYGILNLLFFLDVYTVWNMINSIWWSLSVSFCLQLRKATPEVLVWSIGSRWKRRTTLRGQSEIFSSLQFSSTADNWQICSSIKAQIILVSETGWDYLVGKKFEVCSTFHKNCDSERYKCGESEEQTTPNLCRCINTI